MYSVAVFTPCTRGSLTHSESSVSVTILLSSFTASPWAGSLDLWSLGSPLVQILTGISFKLKRL